MQSSPKQFLSVYHLNKQDHASFAVNSNVFPSGFMPIIVHSPSNGSKISANKENLCNKGVPEETSCVSTTEGNQISSPRIRTARSRKEFSEKTLQVSYAGWKYVKTVEHRMDLSEQIKALLQIVEAACFDLSHLWDKNRNSTKQQKVSFISSQLEFTAHKLFQSLASYETEMQHLSKNCFRIADKKAQYKAKLREAIQEKRKYKKLLEK